MKRDLTVYVASCWWRDSDPHTCVVALTADAAEKAIGRAIQDAADAAQTDEWCVCGEEVTDNNEDEHKDCAIDAQAWSGVFPESLREMLSNERRPGDVIADLRASGVAYLETP